VLGAGVVVSVAGKFWCGFYCCFFLVSVPAFCCCKFFALGGFGSVALVLQLPSVCILSIVFPLVCLISWYEEYFPSCFVFVYVFFFVVDVSVCFCCRR
jgi:hypothetical protein